MARYRLGSPIIAVELSSSGMRLIQIGAGEILIVPDPEQGRSLVEIVYHGRNVSVFIQDVMDRGECIEHVEVKAAAGAVSIRAM
jgi:hypothetical protein